MTVQSQSDLDQFYRSADPWNYEATHDDHERKGRLLSLIPPLTFSRTLDIGCGNGFVTVELPGAEVVGVDFSPKAVGFARDRAALRPDAARFTFHAASVFDLDPAQLGTFQLVVITGVLYSQYIGHGFARVRQVIDDILEPGGFLVSCQIDEWSPWRFPYTTVDVSYYQYREYTHRLEVLLK